MHANRHRHRQRQRQRPRWAPCKAKQIPRKRINHLGIASECAKFAYMVSFAAKQKKEKQRKRLPQKEGYQLCISTTLIPRNSQLPCRVYRPTTKTQKTFAQISVCCLPKSFHKTFSLFVSARKHKIFTRTLTHTPTYIHTHTYDCVCVNVLYGKLARLKPFQN